MARGPCFLASGVRLCSMSSTDPRARKAYLRSDTGAPSAELYVHYIDDHITRLDCLGHAELARGFEEWRERLLR
jgi:hypothetical protein